jgi:thiol:disulfide interchange protein/DsbC/DsbD-like thiol-disulfide interchange protein
MPAPLSRRLAAALAAAALSLAAGQARAQDASTVKTENVEARLVSEHAALPPGGTAWLALRLVIRPGWHTYWINPGDSGEATEIAWTLPPGFSAGPIQWPAPSRFVIGPVTNYGYENEAIHLVPVAVPADAKPGQRVTLKAEAGWLVCEKVCIPESGTLSLALLVGADPPRDEAAAPIFARARAGLPKPSPWTATARAGGDTVTLRFAGARLDPQRLADVWFYPAALGALVHSAPQKVTHDGEGMAITVRTGAKFAGLNTLDGVLVIKERLDGGTVAQAFAVSATKTAGGAAGLAAPAGVGFWSALLFALLGGLILNIMPCVFPILSMKALGLAQHGATAGMRRHALAYTGGVLATFAAVGLVLVALKGMGAELGWGFQLQEPVFVLLMAYLIFAIGLNLAGLFSVGESLMGVGQGLAAKGGLAGSFGTGALAVVVASPCTVPFMGAAVGFAVTQPWPATLAVMAALGLGMALPFLALGFAPRALAWLPKPGPWLVRFRQAMAFPMFATAAWLAWVLSLQAGDGALLAALGGAVLIALAAWAWQAGKDAAPRGRVVGAVVALLALVGAAGTVAYAARGTAEPATAAADPRWVPFSPAARDKALAEGKPVFVNFTAAWCVTCIVNEQATLKSDAVFAAMKRKGMVAMKADWTRRDAVIARELAAFGRNGVPLYVIYPPKGSPLPPEVLPQILTETILLDAIAKFPDAPPARAGQ